MTHTAWAVFPHLHHFLGMHRKPPHLNVQSKLATLFKCMVIDICHWHVPSHSQHITYFAPGGATRSLISPQNLFHGSCS